METYHVTFECLNCGHKFGRDIPKGIHSGGKGGACPKCGMDNSKVSAEATNEMITADGQHILHG